MERHQKVGPLAASHPLVSEKLLCLSCNKEFNEGDYVTLISLGPGADPEARAAAMEGRPYNAIAQPVHYACATGDES